MLSQFITVCLGAGWLLLLATPFEIAWEFLSFLGNLRWPQPLFESVPLSIVLVLSCMLVWVLVGAAMWLEESGKSEERKTGAFCRFVSRP